MPKVSKVEKNARALCVELARVTGNRPMPNRAVRLIARSVALDYKTADVAMAYAIQKGWLIGEGEPSHSVCLTDDGRSCRLLCGAALSTNRERRPIRACGISASSVPALPASSRLPWSSARS
jgi:hypothetical protein